MELSISAHNKKQIHGQEIAAEQIVEMEEYTKAFLAEEKNNSDMLEVALEKFERGVELIPDMVLISDSRLDVKEFVRHRVEEESNIFSRTECVLFVVYLIATFKNIFILNKK